MISLTLWSERITNKGEDAFPACLIDEENNTGVIAVADGLGGSGSTPYEIAGKTYTGAYLASRLAIEIVEYTFLEEKDIDSFALKLFSNLQNSFSAKASQLKNVHSKLRTKLIRQLPTTLAGAAFKTALLNTYKKTHHVHFFWAGDSRVYVLTTNGLQQISKDNLTEELDAFENLLHDAPISNCIHANGDFELFSVKLSFQEPVILLCATDGCFGYLPTPMHFEYYLLATLHHPLVCTTEMWQTALQWTLETHTGDDISLALVALGFNNLKQLKFITIDRLIFLKKLIFSNIPSKQQWQIYKEYYYALQNQMETTSLNNQHFMN